MNAQDISEETDSDNQSCELSENDESLIQFNNPVKYFLKIQALRPLLETDLLASNVKWTFFMAAALSCQHDCKLQPFPPGYIDEVRGPQISDLVSVINKTPNLKVLLEYITLQSYKDIRMDVIDLLYWLLVEQHQPNLRLADFKDITTMLETVCDKKCLHKPKYVFEVKATEGFHSTKAFDERMSKKKLWPIRFGFCNLTLDSFYSILQNGFGLNNEPIKLSTYPYAGALYYGAWASSQSGTYLTCTALCEFFCSKEDTITINSKNKSCFDIELHDAQNIRARYLLFYDCRLQEVQQHRNIVSHDDGLHERYSRYTFWVTYAINYFLIVSIGVFFCLGLFIVMHI